jgi:hypothetical protein
MSRSHRSPWRTALPALAAFAAALLAACGPVKVRPEATLPRALMQAAPARAGLVIDEELRHYVHEETRGGGDWQVDLGAGHGKFFRYLFETSFANLQVFDSLDAARAASGLQAIFQPRIEQFSFATANETSAAYWAVTIRYRIGVLTPQGEPVDTLVFTGYGSALGAGGSTKSLTAATHAAMRDAAAKFLVQMPRQPLANKLLAGETLTSTDGATANIDIVEAVPIEPAPAT